MKLPSHHTENADMPSIVGTERDEHALTPQMRHIRERVARYYASKGESFRLDEPANLSRVARLVRHFQRVNGLAIIEHPLI